MTTTTFGGSGKSSPFRPRQRTADDFLQRRCGPGGVYYLTWATLANYFDLPFGSEVAIPSFDIVPEHAGYVFRQVDSKEVKVKLSFDPNDDRKVAILDNDVDPTEFWSAKVIEPVGGQHDTAEKGGGARAGVPIRHQNRSADAYGGSAASL